MAAETGFQRLEQEEMVVRFVGLYSSPTDSTTSYRTRSMHSCSLKFPATSVARTEKSKIPDAIGIPLTTPGDESVIPGGSNVPGERVMLMGVEPRIVVNGCG